MECSPGGRKPLDGFSAECGSIRRSTTP